MPITPPTPTPSAISTPQPCWACPWSAAGSNGGASSTIRPPIAINNLLDHPPNVTDEKIEDSLLDAINYLAILKAYREMRALPAPKVHNVGSVWSHAREVFGESRKAASWMATPNRFCSGMSPEDFIGQDGGYALVMEELDRIEQGVF